MKWIKYLKEHEISLFIKNNKYKILIGSFIIYITFFDHYNLITQWRLSHTINNMYEEIEYYEQEIQQTRELRKSINSDLEEFAREEYYMHRKNEDIFVFNPDEK